MTQGSSRLVVANRIESRALPAAHISVDPSFTYVGGPRFRLYGVADAEQYLFVRADEQHMIQRLVWVQFEGFVPDNERTYRYTVTQTVALGDVQFIYDASSADLEAAIAERPDSDLAAARNYLQAHGYMLPQNVQAQRFVYLIEPDKRNELMIIYGEFGEERESAHSVAAQQRAMGSFSIQFL